MDSRRRMAVAMLNKKPDRVPVAPDMSNMIPCKLTGKPFWDIYLYGDPPLWKAYIDAVRYFGFDGWLPMSLSFMPGSGAARQEEVIVGREEGRIITRSFAVDESGMKAWSPLVKIYYRDNSPAMVNAVKVGFAGEPSGYEKIERRAAGKSTDVWRAVKDYMGGRGVVGLSVGIPRLGNPEVEGEISIYDYYDRYDEVKAVMLKREDEILAHLEIILKLPEKPDFILLPLSGLLVFNTPEIVRDLGLNAIKKITRACREAGVPSQIHCCGPEKALVEMAAFETDLDNINPLELPPMGDCRLAEIKEKFGSRLSLMGNLHTTDVMLKGSVAAVEKESIRAIEEAGGGGGFILSTGDQCGRDTPFENIEAMIRCAEKYGKY